MPACLRRSIAVRWAFRPVHLTIVIGLVSLLQGCGAFRPAEVIYKKDALYNFLEEGFLADDLLQAVGQSTYRSDDGTLTDIRSRCIDRARDMALDRLVSMMLHTRFRIHGRTTTGQAGSFSLDYPRQFTDREILRGATDFSDLLQKHFVAFEDLASTERCLVTVRILEPEIATKIRAHAVSYRPTL